MDNLELAHDGIERAHHGRGGGGHAGAVDPWSLRSAMLIAGLAASAVIVEMSANDAQVAYLASHIASSDTWAQYQAKSVRRTIYLQSVEALTAARAPAASVEAARRQADRMASEPGRDGMAQLATRAREHEAARDRELRLHNGLELGVRGLQIAVVLTSLYIATQRRWLIYGSAALGLVAIVVAVAVAAHVATLP